jgi:uncharacterized membrane protein
MAFDDAHLWLKWGHILSSTVLFGTGIGTAFQMWLAHLQGEVAGIAQAARTTVIADWLFTTPAGIAQPVTGALLIHYVGYDFWASWLVAAYALYVLALACWLPVIWLQIQVRDMARHAQADGTALPARYFRYMRFWFWLGWPAFSALIVIFWLMIAKPDLW